MPFEDVPSQIGYISYLNITQVNCAAVYCLTHVHGSNASGADLRIVSLKCAGFYKGQYGKSFPNSLIIELYYRGRNWHVKYFYTRGTLQICGAHCEDDARDVSERVCDLLNAANDFIKRVDAHRQEIAAAFDWLRGVSVGEQCDTYSHFSLRDDGKIGAGKQRFVALGRTPSIRWPTEVPDVHRSIIEQLRTLSPDLTLYPGETSHDTLVDRMETILGLSPQQRFVVTNMRCFGIVKYYDLGFVLNRYALAQLLGQRGYDVVFDNINSVVVTVHITSSKAFDPEILQRKKDKSGKETYRFNPGGVVDHHGCIDYMMADTFVTLMSDILSMRHLLTL